MPATRQRTCPNGHRFVKSSDCPVCPVCAQESKPAEGLFSSLGAPARRALESKGIHTVAELATYSEAEILSLHGMGRASMPVLRDALASAGLGFRTP